MWLMHQSQFDGSVKHWSIHCLIKTQLSTTPTVHSLLWLISKQPKVLVWTILLYLWPFLIWTEIKSKIKIQGFLLCHIDTLITVFSMFLGWDAAALRTMQTSALIMIITHDNFYGTLPLWTAEVDSGLRGGEKNCGITRREGRSSDLKPEADFYPMNKRQNIKRSKEGAARVW